ncbi:MAG TPA: hypothetical protein VIH61_09780 [Waddliaceae bacterium]
MTNNIYNSNTFSNYPIDSPFEFLDPFDLSDPLETEKQNNESVFSCENEITNLKIMIDDLKEKTEDQENKRKIVENHVGLIREIEMTKCSTFKLLNDSVKRLGEYLKIEQDKVSTLEQSLRNEQQRVNGLENILLSQYKMIHELGQELAKLKTAAPQNKRQKK